MLDEVPSRRPYEGRWVVNRVWISKLAGVSVATASRWYTQRHTQPEMHRHPKVICTLQRTHYFDQQAVEDFWVAWLHDISAGPLGVAGRNREQRAKAVKLALTALRENQGYRRGIAARLARQNGGVERSWQRAVNEARALLELEYKRFNPPAG